MTSESRVFAGCRFRRRVLVRRCPLVDMKAVRAFALLALFVSGALPVAAQTSCGWTRTVPTSPIATATSGVAPTECSFLAGAYSATTRPNITACSISEGTGSLEVTVNNATFSSARVDTWVADVPSCVWASAPPPDPEAVPWAELDLLHAIVGALWFFSLMHGFVVGRSST